VSFLEGRRRGRIVETPRPWQIRLSQLIVLGLDNAVAPDHGLPCRIVALPWQRITTRTLRTRRGGDWFRSDLDNARAVHGDAAMATRAKRHSVKAARLHG
jgi:hypothetical protein